MQADGNLVVYGPGHTPTWQSKTAGNTYATLGLQDDGNLVVIAPGNKPVWASNTAEPATGGPASEVGSAPNPPVAAAPTSYAAVGDSYSAGEGLRTSTRARTVLTTTATAPTRRIRS